MDLNRDHELLVTVRGTQVEVTFNSEAVLTYVLPNRRPAQGQFHIWTYDATAEFLSLEIMSDAILSEADLLAAVQVAESTAKVSGNKMTVASAAARLYQDAYRCGSGQLCNAACSQFKRTFAGCREG